MSKQNIIVFGETGAGKSSAINLILGRKAANVSDRAMGETLQSTAYAKDKYVFYDTAGLNEGKKGNVPAVEAVRNLIKLLKKLEDGVSLLIFVIKKDRITEAMEKNYKLFVETICMRNVPVLLLITRCELEKEPGKWWLDNESCFNTKYGMRFDGAVSGFCGDPADLPPYMADGVRGLREKTLDDIKKEIEATIKTPGWKVEGGWKNWFRLIAGTVLSVILTFINPLAGALTWLTTLVGEAVDSRSPAEKKFYEGFKASGYSDSDANALARELCSNL